MSEGLRKVFASCASEQRPAFVAYLMAGFQRAEDTVPTMRALQDGGADIIELGVPFTDPIADGYVGREERRRERTRERRERRRGEERREREPRTQCPPCAPLGRWRGYH
jgi:tryptophan synthase alpha subunit